MEHQFIKLLLETGENRQALGTIQDAVAHENTQQRVIPGTVAKEAMKIEDSWLMQLLQYYNRDQPSPKVHLLRTKQQTSQSTPLTSFADTYKYALLDGRRVISKAYARKNSAASSLIQIRWHGPKDNEPEPYTGEVQMIFQHQQDGFANTENTLLARIAWLIPSPDTPLRGTEHLWDDFPELGVETWLLDQYAPSGDTNFPPNILPLASIHCQAARGIITYTKPPLWLSTTMDRYPTSFAAYNLGTGVAMAP
ncbi:hypothetical protein R3P38DRAFT_2768634 [Favolaschia claudopus]|uniref:Uncharacterized protein n=1 Tax=Favolaschia claudopus TaxID=2862362 RepID=A0AAW0CQP6_9AGAR